MIMEKIECPEEPTLLRLVEKHFPKQLVFPQQKDARNPRQIAIPNELCDWVDVCRQKGFLTGRTPLELTGTGRIALRLWSVPATATKAKGKPGRKSTIDDDRKIAKEYQQGLELREWEGQADYLRKKHPKRWSENDAGAKSWLSTLLKRVKERGDV